MKIFNYSKSDNDLLLKTYFIFLASGAVSTLTGAILPEMQAEYNLSYSLRGLLLSFQQCGNLAAVFLAGFLPYLIGRKKCTILLASGITLGIILYVLSGNPILLIIAFTLTGVGRGTLSNTSNVVVASITGNSTAGLNILHASFAMGALISPLIAALLVGRWKLTSMIFAVIMAISILFIANSSLSNEREKKEKENNIAFYRDVDFYLVSFILFFYLCSEASLMGWMVTYFTETGLLSPSYAKVMQSLIWIMILAGRIIIASISPKFKNKMIIVLALGLILVFSFILMMSFNSKILMVISLLLVGFSMSGIYPTTISTQNPKYNKNTIATGSCMAIATLGGVLWPNVIGVVAEYNTLKTAMFTILIPLIIMNFLIVFKVFRKNIENNPCR